MNTRWKFNSQLILKKLFWWRSILQGRRRQTPVFCIAVFFHTSFFLIIKIFLEKFPLGSSLFISLFFTQLKLFSEKYLRSFDNKDPFCVHELTTQKFWVRIHLMKIRSRWKYPSGGQGHLLCIIVFNCRQADPSLSVQPRKKPIFFFKKKTLPTSFSDFDHFSPLMSSRKIYLREKYSGLKCCFDIYM